MNEKPSANGSFDQHQSGVVGKFVVPEIDGAFEMRIGLPRPNWPGLYEWVERVTPEIDLHVVWTEIAANWLGRLAKTLGGSYAIWESKNFLLLSSRSKSGSEHLIKSCERFRQLILDTLPGVATDGGIGPHVVLAFASVHTYYNYVADFHPEEGEFGGSAGMFLDEDYSHIAVCAPENSDVEPIIAHELVHNLVRHLAMPIWLNEGVTQVVESRLARQSPFELTKDLLKRHRDWWTPETVQEFWKGTVFHAPDDRQELGYSLAQILFRNLMTDYPRGVMTFLRQADAADAGNRALISSCGTSLSDSVAQFLGDGDWSPVF